MKKTYAYRIVNVFAQSTLAGNALCVFEDARGLDSSTMQALANQFNLSETTFILPVDDGQDSGKPVTVRIFTPTFEMPFAGHPTIGSAYVVRELYEKRDSFSLQMQAGIIPVVAVADTFQFCALPASNREVPHSLETISQAIGVDVADIAAPPLWVNTGSDQLIIELKSQDAVRSAKPDAAKLTQIKSSQNRSMAYLFCATEKSAGQFDVLARFFFTPNGSIAEDPGTGSATANLGGYLLAKGKQLPLTASVIQGEAVKRVCHLGLAVDEAKNIFVSGNVIELGRGTVQV
jgi:trans-2,3-dihydro-3-hydroxyanthranilate isomerase